MSQHHQKCQNNHQNTHHHHHHHHQMEGNDKKWEQNHPNYASIDSGPQTFFYTLTNMLKLNEATNILQIGCGAGKLLSTIIDLKNPNASYYATDLSEGMVKQAQQRLELHFNKYQSKLVFEEWLKLQKISFQVQNGEKVQVKQNVKFDRIIANMVLCHADDPQKMLKNWFDVSSENCLLGVSLLGDPQKNHFVRGIRQSIQEAGQKLPETRPPYYWYDKISKIVESCGWQIIFQWDQNGLFPFLQIESPGLKKMIEGKTSGAARQIFYKKAHRIMIQQKNGVQFWSKMIVAKKKSKI